MMRTENICCNCRFYKGVKGAQGCAPCEKSRKMTMWNDSCKKIWLIPERLTIAKPTEKTNADRIKVMNDEELADFLTDDFCELLCGSPLFCGGQCKEKCLEWLKKEVDE